VSGEVAEGLEEGGEAEEWPHEEAGVTSPEPGSSCAWPLQMFVTAGDAGAVASKMRFLNDVSITVTEQSDLAPKAVTEDVYEGSNTYMSSSRRFHPPSAIRRAEEDEFRAVDAFCCARRRLRTCWAWRLICWAEAPSLFDKDLEVGFLFTKRNCWFRSSLRPFILHQPFPHRKMSREAW
jgi:hypothetical protein